MRVVVAPDSFKGSLTAAEAAEYIAAGINLACPTALIDKVPMADGGEGTVRALVSATAGELRTTTVCGPIGEPVQAEWGILGGDELVAVIEMAAASGLTLINPEQRNPLYTTTYGTGELIKAALDIGCRQIIIGIGGSATNDGGVGMAQALGVKFIDSSGFPVRAGGAYLSQIESIDISALDVKVKDTKFVVACDVDNPLFGPCGAAVVYGPQKGATPSMVELLDRGLEHYARLLQHKFGKDFGAVPGSGAAGGLGAGLLAFVQAHLKRGIDIVISASMLADRIAAADLVITGEGQIDHQTARGKTVWGVAKTAKALGVPVVAIGGSIDRTASLLPKDAFAAVVSICSRPMDLQTAMSEAPDLLTAASATIMRGILTGIAIQERGGQHDKTTMG